MYKSSFGKLYLIPNTLSVNSCTDVIPEVTKKIIKSLNCFVFENEKFGRLYIKKISSKICQKNLTVHILNKNSTENEIQNIIEILLNGNDMGLITDSGCPAIADPGSRLIY
ncbi:MAG: SAM-dependent methyltransferase, partial [Bacteroidota bacterium]|nr:SAM-dependent methyltransferase [Bacteroidota bacterium]